MRLAMRGNAITIIVQVNLANFARSVNRKIKTNKVRKKSRRRPPRIGKRSFTAARNANCRLQCKNKKTVFSTPTLLE